MFNKAILTKGILKYLNADNDSLFLYHQWHANLRILDVDEIIIVSYAPRSRQFIECLNGTVRRELLDQTIFWNTDDLERRSRNSESITIASTYSSLGGDTPSEFVDCILKLPIKLN